MPRATPRPEKLADRLKGKPKQTEGAGQSKRAPSKEHQEDPPPSPAHPGDPGPGPKAARQAMKRWEAKTDSQSARGRSDDFAIHLALGSVLSSPSNFPLLDQGILARSDCSIFGNGGWGAIES